MSKLSELAYLPSTIDEWIEKKEKVCLVTYIILFKLFIHENSFWHK